MRYSIIIAVYNRLQEVQELLDSAEKLDFPREAFEFLFVDDGSNDGFKEYIEHYKSATGLNTRAIFQQNKGPGPARNNGMENSDSDYFIFVDSDCMFPPHWLRTIDDDLLANNYDAFGGPDTCHESFAPLVKAINYSMTSFVGTGGTRGSKKSVAKFYPRSFNMGIRKAVYDRIGGMAQLRHGQDMDYSARIYQEGYTVGLIPEAFVYHKRRTSLFKFLKQVFNWGVARVNLGSMHPEMFKPIHTLPSMVVMIYFMAMILSFFGGIFAQLFSFVLIGHSLVNLYAFIESYMKHKSIVVSFYSVITLNIQVFSYGLGLLYAGVQKLMGKKEAEGFVKNYYGKDK